MLKKSILTILIVFVMQSFTIRNDSFDKYYRSLELLSLPLILDCQKNIDYPDYSKISNDLIEKYTPLGHKTLGRVDLNRNLISIIQVAQVETEVPMIYNYKFDGTPIDTICILSGSCEMNPEYEAHAVAIIEKDKTIKMIDSVIYYRLDKDYKRRQQPDSIVIREWTCKMDDNGILLKSLKIYDTNENQ
jgi:hypothetical protein